MSTATLPAWRPHKASGRWRFIPTLFVLLLGSLATSAAAVVSNGSIVIALAPLALTIAVIAICVTRIRYTLFALMFLSLSVDATGDGPWNSPLGPVGTLLGNNLNLSIPINALALPGSAVILLGLLALVVHRRLVASQIDRVGDCPTALPLPVALGGSFVAVIGLCALGFARNGDMQMAKIQVQVFVLALLMAYLTSTSLRGMRDYRMLGVVVVAAAMIKALLALWIARTVTPPFEVANGRLPYATTHGDSMLFACAAVILVARFAERPVRRHAVWCVLLLPILVVGMLANNRRLVWVEVAAGLLLYVVVSRRTQLKRYGAYALLLSLPLLAAYVGVGWNSKARIFAPVSTFRSVGDSDVDASTLYRDLENYNLLATIRLNPLTGTGFGHPFNELVTLPNISFFKEYRYLPHNSILGLWAFTGAFGFFGLSLAIVVAVYLAGRSYRAARCPEQRVAAFAVLATVLIYLIHCWGDIGFTERRGIFLLGPALAVAGHVASSTGAWLTRRPASVNAEGRLARASAGGKHVA